MAPSPPRRAAGVRAAPVRRPGRLEEIGRWLAAGLWPRLAVWLSLTAVAGLAFVAAWDPPLASKLSSEDHALEWAQVALLAGAATLSGRQLSRQRGDGLTGAPDLLLTLMFAILIAGELELQRRLMGGPLRLGRLLQHPASALPREWVVAIVLGAGVIVVAVYALYHRAELWRWARAMVADAWGRMLLVGVVIFGLAQAFEGPLRHLSPPLPRYLAEETLELLATLYFLLAMLQREFPTKKRHSPEASTEAIQ